MQSLQRLSSHTDRICIMISHSLLVHNVTVYFYHLLLPFFCLHHRRCLCLQLPWPLVECLLLRHIQAMREEVSVSLLTLNQTQPRCMKEPPDSELLHATAPGSCIFGALLLNINCRAGTFMLLGKSPEVIFDYRYGPCRDK